MMSRDGEAAGSGQRLVARFEEPGDDHFPVPIWWWSGETLDAARLRQQLEWMRTGGIRQAVILNLAPNGPHHGSVADDPPFFSEVWWQVFLAVCGDARDLGMGLWFYDQLGFSGSPLRGELVRDDPSFGGVELEHVEAVLRRGEHLALPEGTEPLGAWVTPVDADGAASEPPTPVDCPPGGVPWEQDGPARVILVGVARRGFDHLSRRAGAALIDAVHGELARRAGEHLGRTIVGTFQDEFPTLPTWSPTFADEFRSEHGYDLVAELHELFGPVTARSPLIRAAYQATRARLAEEAIFGPLAQWHREHGLLAGFDQQHPARAGYPIACVQSYADYFRTHRSFSAPGSDHWGDAKIHSSMAHLYGHARTWIEAFHSTGWGGTLEETFDWLLPWIRAGANLYNPHAVYYSARHGWWEWAPPSTCWRQPYWRHYAIFATAVARLCSVLSGGLHVCDVAVLFPTTTVQSSLAADAAQELFPKDDPAAAADWAHVAHQTYLALVGKMHWFAMETGALDADHRDFDVIDDGSLGRAQIQRGALVVSGERYRAVVLPACAVIEAATAEALCRFVDAGGRLVAVGVPPRATVGADDGEGWLQQLRDRFDAGAARLVARPTDVASELQCLGRRVDAPVPVLERVDGETHVLFVPAAWPGATAQPIGPPGTFAYDFDSSRYTTSMTIRIDGPVADAQAWDPMNARRAPVRTGTVGTATVVELPFTSPAMLLVWNERSPLPAPTATGVDPAQEAAFVELSPLWDVELVPTLATAGHDVGPPGLDGGLGLAVLDHRCEAPGEDGLGLGWHVATVAPDAQWSSVDAGFGARSWVTEPTDRAMMRRWRPGEPTAPALAGWRPAVYSLSAGFRKPRGVPGFGGGGYVPEEFIDLGEASAGSTAQLRTWIPAEEETDVLVDVGAAATKLVWWNGRPVRGSTTGYHSSWPVHVEAGLNVLDVGLTSITDGRLRASWALVPPAAWTARPEWVVADGEGAPGNIARLRLSFDCSSSARAVVQLGSDGLASLRCNGAAIGRQGDFDHYAGLQRSVRILRYDLTEALRVGANEIIVECPDSSAGEPVAILIDGRMTDDAGGRLTIVSGPHWSAERNGRAVAVVPRLSQERDPRYVQLFPRPHPLPLAGWPEGQAPSPLAAAYRAGEQRHSVDWFRVMLPPGATGLRLPSERPTRVFIDGVEVGVGDGGEVSIVDGHGSPPRLATIRIAGKGVPAGGRFSGAIPVSTGGGRMPLGDWLEMGLGSYSGGVRYRQTITVDELGEHAAVDLGEVRGSASVKVNGADAGVRVCWPYRFDAEGLLRRGANELEVTVFNTLAPHLDAHSPTSSITPAQKRSGLFGPVRIVMW